MFNSRYAHVYNTSEKVYFIVKDGKYLSRMAPLSFGESRPIAGLVYWYHSELIANDVAAQIEGSQVEAGYVLSLS